MRIHNPNYSKKTINKEETQLIQKQEDKDIYSDIDKHGIEHEFEVREKLEEVSDKYIEEPQNHNTNPQDPTPDPNSNTNHDEDDAGDVSDTDDNSEGEGEVSNVDGGVEENDDPAPDDNSDKGNDDSGDINPPPVEPPDRGTDNVGIHFEDITKDYKDSLETLDIVNIDIKKEDETELITENKSFNRILNCNESRNKEKDWTIITASKSNIVNTKSSSVPDNLDLRADWFDIGDQGETGSCVGWGTGDGALRYYFVKKGLIDKTDRISPRYLWMSAKESDTYTSYATTFIEEEGTSIKTALDVARKFGCVTEDVLPFDGTLYKGDLQSFYSTASKLKISSYYSLGVKDLSSWKTWLYQHGALVAALNCDFNFMNLGSSGVLSTYNSKNTYGVHCVSIVGYKPGYYIIRNSWNTSWGDKGYAYASESYIKNAFLECYGIA